MKNFDLGREKVLDLKIRRGAFLAQRNRPARRALRADLDPPEMAVTAATTRN
jgi:hypothetical protein